MAFRPLGLVLLCTMLHLFIPFQIEAQAVTTTRRPGSNTTNLDDLIDFPDDDNGTGNGTDTGDKETPTGLFNLFGLGTVLTYLVYTGVGLLVVLLVTLYISTNCTGAQKTRPLTIANVEAFKLSQAGPEAQRAIASGMDEFAAGGANDPYNHKKAILAKFLSESNQNSKQLKKKTHTGDTVIDMKMSHDIKVTVEDPELAFDSVSVVGAARTANNKMPFYDNSKNNIILNVPGSKGLDSYADGGSEVGSDQSASEAESSAYSEGESQAG